MNPDTIPRNEMDIVDVMAFLKHYGYLSDIIDDADQMPVGDLVKSISKKRYKDTRVRDAVARFQDFYNITKDGEFGYETMRAMAMPRCGVPDIVPAGAEAAGQCKWPHLDVTYAFDLQLNNLSDDEVERAFVEACDLWNAVCGLRLTRIDNLGDANIWARSRRIDGRGGTLAWSYLPCGASRNTQLEQRYDPGESWSYRFAVEVICHEVGHAIGLNHINGNSIMHPTATGQWPVPQPVDIRRVVDRYGEPQPEPEPPKPEPPADPGDDSIQIGGSITINGSPYRLVPDVTLGGL